MWGPPTKEPVLRVSELAAIIKTLLLDERLQDVQIEGELTNYKHHSRGNRYFSLSEENGRESAVIRCMMWSQDADRLSFIPGDGMHVVARGRVDFYGPGGNCQLYVKTLRLAGAGEKYLLVERWKQELAKEGCFDPGCKKELPRFPDTVGVVTSRTGAVIQDIRNVIRRRFPVTILLSPTAVQGDGAHAEIVEALRRLDGKVDVIILARGGGSFEDLFPFNHPDVVHAIVACRTPVVSAIGHEVDTTLSDYAADARAPTPSAAAELVVPDRNVVLSQLREYQAGMDDYLGARLERAYDELGMLQERIHPRKLEYRVIERRQNIDDLAERILVGTRGKIAHGKARLKEISAIIEGKNPHAILRRGYSMIEKEGKIIRSAYSLRQGDDVTIRLADGSCRAGIQEVSHDKEV